MAAEDLVKDRITRKNNPNLKNISSIQLMSSPEHKRDYIEALQGQEERLMSDQKEKQKSKMNLNDSIKKEKFVKNMEKEIRAVQSKITKLKNKLKRKYKGCFVINYSGG